MRLSAVGLGVGAGLLLAACGGSTKTIVKTVTAAPPAATSATVASPTTTTAAATSTTAAAADPTSCDAKGIDPQQLRQGTCVTKGVTFTVVNKGSVLRMHSLTASLNGIRAADSLSSDVSSATASGMFVISSLTVTNRLDSPQTFDQIGTAQTQLLLGRQTFTENFDAENGNDPQSCVSKDDAGIQPGESLTCDVIFDVPTSSLAKLTTNGNISITNFGDDIASSGGPFGVFRTYH